MTQGSNMSDFKLQIPIQKSEGLDGWYIKGIASGPGPDLQDQEVHAEALSRFVNQINAAPIPFLDWHNKDSSAAEIGEVVKAWIEPDGSMGVEVKLDEDHPTAAWLWKKLDKGKKFGMSIFGKAVNVKKDFDRSLGKSVLKIYDAVLSEISLTTKPIWTPSFGTVMKKAIDADQSESVEKGDNSLMEKGTPKVGVEQPADAVTDPSTTENQEETTEETEETATVESSAPETETADSAPEVSKAVSADTKRDGAKLRKLVKLHHEMASLISELGLSEDELAGENTDSTVAAVETVEKAVSEPNTDALNEATKEITSLREELERLREQLPAVATPPVLIQKSEVESIMEELSTMSPRDKLRFGLAGIERNIR